MCAYQGVRNVSFSENFAKYQMNDPQNFVFAVAQMRQVKGRSKFMGQNFLMKMVVFNFLRTKTCQELKISSKFLVTTEVL